MKKIVCEMCGDSNLIKQDGLFVCQTCGCKYTLEEARKMMVEVDGAEAPAASTGAQTVAEITGAGLSTKDQQLIENYLSICENAQKSMDTVTTVEYSDKIIELDPNNYLAWKYRALACGWDSSLNNMKTGQVIAAAKKAIELAPEPEKADLAEQIFIQAKLQIVSHLKRVFSLSSTAVLTASLTLAAKQAEMAGPVMSAWVMLVREIPDLSRERIEKEIADCRTTCDSHSVIIGTTIKALNGGKPYYESMREQTQAKLEIEDKERARKLEEYWEEHAEQKAELDAEYKELEKKIAELTEKMDSMKEPKRLEEVTQEIRLLDFDLKGAFLKKKKDQIQEQIDAFEKEKEELMPIVDAVKIPLEEAQTRFEEIKKLLFG